MSTPNKNFLFKYIDHKLYGDSNSPQSSPRQTSLRWIALFFCCLSTLGGYYCTDAISPLQTPIMELFKIDAAQFNVIFSAYSTPNIIMPLLGGFIIDKLGVRIGLSLFALLVCLGQAVVTFGASYPSFTIMIIGTGAMGIGLEALCTAKCAMVVKWFKGQEIAFALGLTLTISRLGSSLSSYLTPWIYEQEGNLIVPMAVGVVLSAFSLCMIGLLSILDKYADVKDHELHTESGEKKEEFKISDMKSFPAIYYMIMLNCMIAYSAIKGFLNNGSDLMMKRFGFDLQLAGKYLSIVFILSTIFSPIFGGIADKFGKRVSFLLASFVVLALVHVEVLLLEDGTPTNKNYWVVFAMVGTGIAYSAYAAIIWPCISLVVEQRMNGTAYGFTVAMQNLLCSIIPPLLGYLHDQTTSRDYGYFWTEVSLLVLSVMGILATILIRFKDRKMGLILEGAPKRIQAESTSYYKFKDEKSTQENQA